MISSKNNESRFEVDFELGSPVWLYCYFRKNDKEDSRVAKLAYKWHGPFRIVKKISDNVYQIEVNDNKLILVNVNRLKKYSGFWSRPDDDIEDHDIDEGDHDILDVLPEDSFVNGRQHFDGDEVLINTEEVVKSVVDKRIERKNKKKIVKYLVLLKNGLYVWKTKDALPELANHVDEYENEQRKLKEEAPLRRSRRVANLDYEVGESQVYYH